ncbi:MAG: hypothetical protein H6Q22_1314 [Bacteroidetes bacterium]|nr:hypothetical protein [Bacteroidota bacterium]
MLEIRINKSKAKIGKILVKEGDLVSSGDAIMSIEVGKAQVIIGSNFTGKILSVNKKVGDVINPHDIVFTVEGKVTRKVKDIIIYYRD